MPGNAVPSSCCLPSHCIAADTLPDLPRALLRVSGPGFMRIAFDIDGVLADLHEPFVEMALRLFPELDPAAVHSPDIGASPPDIDTAPTETTLASATAAVTDLPLFIPQSAAVWRALSAVEDFWSTLKEIEPGSVARLAALTDERRWEVVFITSRPESAGGTVQRQSQRWLERRGFPLPSAYVVHGSRGRIADALQLDIVVDDRPENCLDVALESNAGAMLLWRGTRQSIPTVARRFGIVVVPTVSACLDALVNADTRQRDSGLLDRLRRLFGLPSGKLRPRPRLPCDHAPGTA